MLKIPEKVLFIASGQNLPPGLRGRLFARFCVVMAADFTQAARVLETTPGIGVVVADLDDIDSATPKQLAQMRRAKPEVRCVLLVRFKGEKSAPANIGAEVFRLLRKPVDPDFLAEVLESALEEYRFAADTGSRYREIDVTASARRTRQGMFATISHEMRTPLNHILGFSALLEQRCKQKGERESLEYLAYIRESGETLLRTFDRMITIARLFADDQGPEAGNVDVNAVLAEVVDACRADAAEQGIAISCDAPLGLPEAEANARELAQAFAELLDNAIKFNRPGGHIAIAAHASGKEIAIRVADTGIGMAEGELRRALGVLPQKNGASRRFDKNGIGLALAALTAERHGGGLTIQSRKGHGTAVVLRLKRAAARQAVRIA